MARLFVKALPWLLWGSLVLLWQGQPAFLQMLQLKTFDVYQQLWPRTAPENPQVLIVDIDEASLKAYGQWPWPRTVLAKMVNHLFEAGATAVAFDMVFAEPDRTSPENAAPLWPLPPLEKAHLKKLPAHDTVFTHTLENRPVVLGYALDTHASQQHENDFDIFSDVTGSGLDALQVPQVDAIVRNLPALEEKAPALGWFGYIAEHDNIVRRVPLLVRYQDAVFAPLSIKLLRAYSQTPTLEPVVTEGARIKALKFGAYEVPTDEHGVYWIHFRKQTPHNKLSAADVLQKTPTLERVNGKMILIGTSAEGLLDVRATPLEAKVPGVDIHAQLIENILAERYLQRPAWLPVLERGGTCALGILLLLGMSFFGAGLTSIVAAGAVIAMPIVGLVSFQQGFLVDAFVPAGLLFIVFAVAVLIQYAQEERQRKAIRRAFAHYLSPEMVQQVSQNPKQLQLGGEQKPLTLLFCDIRNFTSLSEGFAPQELTAFINAYLTPMTDIILNHQGTIDKYMGDAIMAFWNAPVDVPQHPQQACAAVLAMQEQLQKLNTTWRAHGLPKIAIGIGLHTGVATVGNMGSDQRFDYTVMGDTVNLASRLEGLCKPYGVGVAVSEEIKNQVPEGIFLPLDHVIVKGKSTPVGVYELLGLGTPTPEQEANINAMEQVLAAYQKQDWDTAEKALHHVHGHAKLVQLYQERIDAYRQTPPPAHWTGAWERREK